MNWYILSLLLFIGSRIAQCTCYDGKGTELPSGWKACNSDANTNSCCNKGGGDICTSSGLCLRQDGVANGFWYQDGCTNKAWQGCTKMCPETLQPPWELVPCNDDVNQGSWCCRTSGTTENCCSNSTAVFTSDIGKLMMTTVTISGTSTSTLSNTPAVTATVTTTASASNASDSVKCSSKSTAAVGAGVGVSLGALLAASLATLVWRERTRPKPQAVPSAGGYYPTGSEWTGQKIDRETPVEMDARAVLYEADSRPRGT